MSKVLVTESYLDSIADAIRSKNGTSTTYRPGDMAAAIQAIPTGGITPTGTKNISQNGLHDVTEYASANVNVQPNLQSKTATENGTVLPDQGYDGLSSVTVNVSGGGGSAFAYAVCHGTTGTTVTATDGITTLNGTISGGRLLFGIPNSGTWTFTNDGVTVQKSITTQGEVVDVSFIFVIHQNYTPNGAVFEYANEGKIMVCSWSFLSSPEGFTFDTIGYTRVKMNTGSQAGTCTNTATLPDITNTGAGRTQYTINFPRTFDKSGTDRFFAVFYTQTVGSKVYLIIEAVS